MREFTFFLPLRAAAARVSAWRGMSCDGPPQRRVVAEPIDWKMISTYTFIMNSEEIGESIDQFQGETMRDAWVKWAVSAADWIIRQLPDSNLETDLLIEEICNEIPKKLCELDNVWLGDIYPDHCEDVIQVIVVGPASGAAPAPRQMD